MSQQQVFYSEVPSLFSQLRLYYVSSSQSDSNVYRATLSSSDFLEYPDLVNEKIAMLCNSGNFERALCSSGLEVVSSHSDVPRKILEGALWIRIRDQMKQCGWFLLGNIFIKGSFYEAPLTPSHAIELAFHFGGEAKVRFSLIPFLCRFQPLKEVQIDQERNCFIPSQLCCLPHLSQGTVGKVKVVDQHDPHQKSLKAHWMGKHGWDLPNFSHIISVKFLGPKLYDYPLCCLWNLSALIRLQSSQPSSIVKEFTCDLSQTRAFGVRLFDFNNQSKHNTPSIGWMSASHLQIPSIASESHLKKPKKLNTPRPRHWTKSQSVIEDVPLLDDPLEIVLHSSKILPSAKPNSSGIAILPAFATKPGRKGKRSRKKSAKSDMLKESSLLEPHPKKRSKKKEN